MSLEIKCDKCKKELDVPGGLIFSPPDNSNQTLKIHICIDCFKGLYNWLFGDER